MYFPAPVEVPIENEQELRFNDVFSPRFGASDGQQLFHSPRSIMGLTSERMRTNQPTNPGFLTNHSEQPASNKKEKFQLNKIPIYLVIESFLIFRNDLEGIIFEEHSKPKSSKN